MAGRNFGGGSSREQAPVALKYAGISAAFRARPSPRERNALRPHLPGASTDDAERRGRHSHAERGNECQGGVTSDRYRMGSSHPDTEAGPDRFRLETVANVQTNRATACWGRRTTGPEGGRRTASRSGKEQAPQETGPAPTQGGS